MIVLVTFLPLTLVVTFFVLKIGVLTVLLFSALIFGSFQLVIWREKIPAMISGVKFSCSSTPGMLYIIATGAATTGMCIVFTSFGVR